MSLFGESELDVFRARRSLPRRRRVVAAVGGHDVGLRGGVLEGVFFVRSRQGQALVVSVAAR